MAKILSHNVQTLVNLTKLTPKMRSDHSSYEDFVLSIKREIEATIWIARPRPVMSNFIIALTTCPMRNSEELARILVEERVCACVNVIPKLTSIYHWKGEIAVEEEALLIMKTKETLTSILWEVVKKNHPYEVPEYVVLPIHWGSQDYLEWISENVKSV